jgi:hypothetical protein
MSAPWWRWRRRRTRAEDSRALETWQPDDSEPAEIYARALLRRAEITEDYFVAQEISKNPSATPGKSPAGRIEFAIPYDGHEYFTRAAKADVAHQTRSAQPGGSAVIGHLLLKDHAATDLRQRLDLGDRYGSIPIEVPVGNGAPDESDPLTADQWICTTTYDFEPNEAAVLPARLEINLFDPDSLDLPPTDLRIFDLHTDEARQGINDSIAKIVRHVSFKDELVLQIVVHASLPAHAEFDRPWPRIARVAIHWPTITSLDALRLEIPTERPRLGVPLQLTKAPFRYNPVRGCIEWGGVRMFATDEKAEAPDKKPHGTGKDEKRGEDEKSGTGGKQGKDETPGTGTGETPQETEKPGEIAVPGGEGGEKEKPKEATQDRASENEARPGASVIRRYQSMPMLLAIRYPGELYKQPTLMATAEVAVPNYLMSGMSARLYDATGYYLKDPLRLTTRIHAAAQLQLDDAFAMRDRSPSQHLFFDEVIPEEIRITDIRTALEDRGFAVEKVWPPGDGSQYDEEAETDSWLLVAHRKVGPDDMVLWVLTEGEHSGTDRDRVLPGGGVMHKTWLPSGELRIVIRGSLPGDSKGRLTHEMNVLHGMLWERYGRLRQRR